MTQDDRRERGRPVDAPSRGPAIPGERARQGRIVLNTPARRWIFVGGLVLFVIAAALVAL